jgi:hypothetical protein
VRAFSVLDLIPVGETTTAKEIAKQISNRRVTASPYTTASFIKERDDYRLLGEGIWQRIAIAETEGVKA